MTQIIGHEQHISRITYTNYAKRTLLIIEEEEKKVETKESSAHGWCGQTRDKYIRDIKSCGFNKL